MWSRVAVLAVCLLAGCAGLTDGAVLFKIAKMDNGESIFEAHVDAVDAKDIMYWGGAVVVSADGKVAASHSSLVWGDKQSSHATSINGRDYFDNSHLFDQQKVEIPEGETVTAPASLGMISIGTLRNIAGDGRITVSYISDCVEKSGDDAEYAVSAAGAKKGSFECEDGDWSAIVIEDPEGPNSGEFHTVILRA